MAIFSQVALPELDRIHTSAICLTGNEDLAQDLVQETLLRAFRFFHRFEVGTNCRAWLLTILHHTFFNRYRAERRERGRADIDEPAVASEARISSAVEDDPEALFLSNQLDGEIVEALRGLPEEYRTVIVLVDLQDLTYEESSRVLGCPIGTVRSRLSRGRLLLRKRLLDYAVRRGHFRRSCCSRNTAVSCDI